MNSRFPAAELNRRLGWALPALAALVFGIVRLPELIRSPLWYDELFSLGVAGLPLADSLRRIVADHTNPPLFYLLLKAWMAFGGDGDQWVRLLPCLFAMFLGAALVWLAREARAGAWAGTLAVALAAASPLLVDLANEVRAYSLLALLACLSLAATLDDRHRGTRNSFAVMTLINIALVHTHYFGWLTVGAECAAALCCTPRTQAWRTLRSALYTLLAFLPWGVTVAAHALGNRAPLRNVAWISAPDAAAPLWLVRDLTGRSGSGIADLAWLAFVAVAVVMFAAALWRRRSAPVGALPASSDAVEAHTAVLLALAGLGVPLLVWGWSVASGHSVWVQRYLLGTAAPVALLVAMAVVALPPRRWALTAIAGFLWAAASFAELPLRAPTKFDWRRFTLRIERSVGSPADVYALEAFTAAPFQRYARAGMRLHMVSALDQLPSGDLWLLYRRDSFAAGSPAEALRALGFRTVSSLSAETAGQKIVAVRIQR